MLTSLGIWVRAGRKRPLPIITTANKDKGSNLIHHSELDSRAGWCRLCRVITVENGRHTQNGVGTMVVGIEKIFQIQKGRSVSNLKPMVADLVGQ